MNLRLDAIAVMMTMFAAAVMAVDPMMAVLRPMAGNPDHFVITSPIARTVTVVRPITNFDSESLRLNGAPESEAGSGNRCKQQCFIYHKSDSDGIGERTGRAAEKLRPNNGEPT
jgi:hypothetical protein